MIRHPELQATSRLIGLNCGPNGLNNVLAFRRGAMVALAVFALAVLAFPKDVFQGGCQQDASRVCTAALAVCITFAFLFFAFSLPCCSVLWPDIVKLPGWSLWAWMP